MTLLEELDRTFPETNFLLAFLCARGLGVDRDLSKAREFCRIAADADLPAAQYLLGCLIESDKTGAESRNQVIHWYTRAADRGHSLAAFKLGDLYEQGQMAELDAAKCVYWYTVSANLGCATAACHLGWLYEEGALVERDDSMALAQYKRAVEIGSVAGCMSLARAYRKGSLGLPIDIVEASRLETQADLLRESRDAEDLERLRDAASHGDQISQEILAMAYQSGALGLKADNGQGKK